MGGIILTNKSMIKLNNVAKNPMEDFELSEDDLVLLDDENTYGTFHTHPGRGANLSIVDYLTFKKYPRLTHYIIGKDGVKCYKMQGGILIEKS